MSKWNVHYGCRLTCNVEVEADTEEEAIDKARDRVDSIPYDYFNFADDDVDIWEIK